MKRITSMTLCALAALALAAGDAAAQWNVARFETNRNRVYTTFGLDPAFVGSAGYARVVSVLDHDFQLSGDAGLATAKLDAHDFRARLGTQTSLIRWRSARLTGSATFISRGTDNVIYRGFNFGADLTAALGVYRPRWFAAGEFGKDKAIMTHITHSDWYRKYGYAEAKDGWYLDAGGTFHYGVAGGLSIGSTEVVGRAGWLRTERFRQMSPPIYVSVGVGRAF